jgi:hypothetical protein
LSPAPLASSVGGDEVTIRASTILSAQRIARQLTVNALAVSVLNDARDIPEETAQQPEPNARPRPQYGVSTLDYVTAYFELSETITAGVEARVEGDLERAARLHRKADRLAALTDDLYDALRRSRSNVSILHPTRYRLSLPPIAYVHPDPAIGIHARQDARVVRIDTVSLEGEDRQVFNEFRVGFPARGKWPLYAPHNRDGLQPTSHHELADEARRVFGQLIAQHPGCVPQVYAVAPDEPAA